MSEITCKLNFVNIVVADAIACSNLLNHMDLCTCVCVSVFACHDIQYGNNMHCIHFSEDEFSDVSDSLKPHLLVKACLSGLAQSQSV